MELTQEYFDEKLAGLATKDDLQLAIKPLATKKDLQENFEELARMTADGFAEAAKQRSIEAIKEELVNIRKVIDKMFEQMDRDFEMRALHEKELLGLRARVEKIEDILRRLNIQGAGL